LRPHTLEEGIHEVRRDVDGDTILLASGARVRLQASLSGIREAQLARRPWGPEASQSPMRLLKRANKRVRLTFSDERKDRTIAFWVRLGRRCHASTKSSFAPASPKRARLQLKRRPERRFSLAQDEARKASRGIWSTPEAHPANSP